MQGVSEVCGIGGFYNCSGGLAPLPAIKSLWRGLEARGVHAAGFAVGWMDADQPVSVKQSGPAHRMFDKLSRYIDGSHTQYVLLHTRYATQGSTSKNGNNHPVCEHGFTTIHNGWVNNYEELMNDFEVQYGISRVNEVDSELLNVILKTESIETIAEEVDGPVSLAWIDNKNAPMQVNLFTNGLNPLVIARTKSNDIVWASTISILEASDFDIDNWFHASPFKVYSLNPDGTITSKFISGNRREAHTGAYRAANSAGTGGWGFSFQEVSENGSKPSNTATSVKPSPTLEATLVARGWVYSQKRGWVQE